MTDRRPSFASTPAVRTRMQRQRRRDTSLEVQLRSLLHRRGLRFRVQYKVMHRRTADIVFTRARVVVDIRSCFWHGCPLHFKPPSSNTDWWAQKVTRVTSRDNDTVARLEAEGWSVVVVWQHENLDHAAKRVHEEVIRRR